jgi:DnaJ-class molecular chaperone
VPDPFQAYLDIQADQRAAAENACKLCRGTGFNLEHPRTCKNCKGTKRRGSGQCHKCIINSEPSGLALDFCPACHGPEYFAKLDLSKTPPHPEVQGHKHGGMFDVQCGVVSDGE